VGHWAGPPSTSALLHNFKPGDRATQGRASKTLQKNHLSLGAELVSVSLEYLPDQEAAADEEAPLSLQMGGLCHHLLDALKWKDGNAQLAGALGRALGLFLVAVKARKQDVVATAARIQAACCEVLVSGGAQSLTRFAAALDELTRHCPEAMAMLKEVAVQHVSNCHGDSLVKVVRSFSRQTTGLRELSRDLEPLLPGMMEQQPARLPVLELLGHLLPALRDDEAALLLRRLVLPVLRRGEEARGRTGDEDRRPGSKTGRGTAACRLAAASALTDTWATRPSLREDFLRPPLLALLGDPDDQVRDLVINFWHHEVASSTDDNPCSRLRRLLEHHHLDRGSSNPDVKEWAADVESAWTPAAVALMLKLAEGHPRYEAPIFDYPLASCEFHDYQVDVMHGGSSSSMTRSLFSELSSQAQAAALPAGFVRATQETTIGPTMTLSLAIPTAGWLTAHSDPQDSHRTQQLSRGEPHLQFQQQQSAATGAVGVLRGAKAAAHAKAAAQRHKLQSIQLTRKYRKGELPDIESISVSSIFRPLFMLCARDGNIASATITAVAQAVCAAETALPGDRGPAAAAATLRCLDTVFSRQLEDAQMVGALQALAVEGQWERGVDAGRAAEAAFAAGNLAAGAFQVEDAVIRASLGGGQSPGAFRGDCAVPPPAKRQRSSSLAEAAAVPSWDDDRASLPLGVWRSLAKMYTRLEQSELETLVRVHRLAACKGLQAALAAASRGEMRAAFGHYDTLADDLLDIMNGEGEEDTDDDEARQRRLADLRKMSKEDRDVCYDACFEERRECLLALGEWQHLVAEAEEETRSCEGDPPVLGNLLGEAREHLQPWLRGSLYRILPTVRLHTRAGPCEELAKCKQLCDEAQLASRGERVLMERAGKEVALLSACLAAHSPELDRAESLVSVAYDFLRAAWGRSSWLDGSARRHAVLLDLQLYAEIGEALRMLGTEQRKQQQQPSSASRNGRQPFWGPMVAEWRRRRPSVTYTPAAELLSRVCARALLLRAVNDISGAGRGLAPHWGASQARAELLFDGAAMLLEGCHWDSAAALLDQLADEVGSSYGLVWQRAKLQLGRAKALGAGGRVPAKLMQATSVLQQLPEAQVCDKVDHHILLLDAYQCMVQRSSGADKRQLEAHSLQTYHEAAAAVYGKSASQQLTMTSNVSRQLGVASLKLALFCNGLMTACDKGDALVTVHGLAGLAVRHFLSAIRFGGTMSGAGRSSLFVPRVLGILSTAADGPEERGGAREARAEQPWQEWAAAEASGHLPAAALLPWVVQMVAFAGSTASGIGSSSNGRSAVVATLERLAGHFPQQLHFPLKLAQPYFSDEGRQRLQSLQDLLRSPVLEDFAAALNNLTYPSQRWDCHASSIMQAVCRGRVEQAQRAWEAAFADCFTTGRGGDLSGPINERFAYATSSAARDMGHKLKRCGWESLKPANCESLVKALSQAVARASKGNDRNQKPRVSDFSKWFAHYGAHSQSGSGLVAVGAQGGQGGGAPSPAGWQLLDMPGLTEEACLTGRAQLFKCPKVVSFSATVSVFKSKQKPKLLHFFGDDFRTYSYVVKGAEDVRIDQRVAMLFRVMAGLLTADPSAAAQRLGSALRTFAVVPLSPILGLLSFVPNTSPLLEATKAGGRLDNTALDEAHKAYSLGLQKLGVQERVYDSAFMAQDCTVARLLADCQAQVPWDTLRQTLLRVSSGPPGFLATRARFAATLATISTAGYIAGVGDRHLQNFLLDMNSGELVAIDFGYSFGTAAQALPIPELIPFRMTRCLVGALAPFGDAALQEPVRTSLGVFREAKPLLEGILSIFLSEPLQEWQREGDMLERKWRKVDMGADRPQQEPQEEVGSKHIALKLQHTSWKLEGRHPSEVLVEELRGAHGRKKCWQRMKLVVEGTSGGSGAKEMTRRAAVAAAAGPGASLRVSQQAECLLELAMDPHVLGRTFAGWRPWL